MGISRIKPAELLVAAVSLVFSLPLQADVSNLSAAQRLAKRSIDRYYAIVEDGIFKLSLCNFYLQKSINKKDAISTKKYRNEFVDKAYKLSVWGGIEIHISEITTMVRDGVDNNAREKFIYKISRSLEYHYI